MNGQKYFYQKLENFLEIKKEKGEFMYSQEINAIILRRELEMGPNEQCLTCGNTFHAYKDSCPACGSLRTKSIIDMGEIKTIKLSASEYFAKVGFIPIRNEEGFCEFIFAGKSSPWPRKEEKK